MERKIKVAVCDDEMHVLQEQCKMVGEVLGEKKVQYIVNGYETPEKLLADNNKSDIYILDIELKNSNGIEIAKKLKSENKDCIIFFVTNHETYLDDAFDNHAFRFWTKPMDKKRLSLAIDSAIKEIEKNERFIVVAFGAEKIKVMQKSIVYVNVVMKKTIIVTQKGTIETNDSFSDIIKPLIKSGNFFETHRGYCVNFEYVTNYDKTKVFCTAKEKKHEVYLSRRKYALFAKSFMEWMGSE